MMDDKLDRVWIVYSEAGGFGVCISASEATVFRGIGWQVAGPFVREERPK